MKRISLLLMALILASVGMQAKTEKTSIPVNSVEVFYNFGTTADWDAASQTLTASNANSSFGIMNLNYSMANYDRLVVKYTNVGAKPWFTRLRIDNGNEPYYEEETSGDLDTEKTATISLTNGLTSNQEGKDATPISTIGRIYFFVMGDGKIKINEIYLEKDITGESIKTNFTVSDNAFNLNLWGDTNSKDAGNNAFTLAADGNSVGWDYYYSGKLDISTYDRLVVKLKSVSDNKTVSFRIRGMKDANTDANGCYSVDLNAGNNYTTTINLADGITTNTDLGDNPATAINLKMINTLLFWAWAGEVTVTIDEIYLEKDAETPDQRHLRLQTDVCS